MAVAITGTLTSQTSGTTALSFSVGSLANGSWMLLAGANSNSSLTLTASGWTPLFSKTTMGSRAIYAWAKFKESGDTTLTVTKSASDYASGVIIYGTGADIIANWQVGTVGLRASGVGTSTTSVAPSITTTAANCMVVAALYEATNATESQPSQSGSGWTHLTWLGQGGGSGVQIETIDTAYRLMSGTGATGAVTNTYTNSQASNGAGIQVAIPPAAPSNVAPTASFTSSVDYLTVSVNGTASTDSDGTIASYDWNWGDGTTHGTGSTASHTYAAAGTYTITLTVADDDSATGTEQHEVEAIAPPGAFYGTADVQGMYYGNKKVLAMYYGDALVKRWGWTVADLLADSPNMHVGHRGLGGSYPEQSMAGYEAAVAAGFKALEVSLHRSSDGVFVASHDSTTTRVFGVSHTISAQTWSTLSSLNSATGPILRLEDILDAFGGTHVIFIDDKNNANAADLLNLLDNYPDPQQHFVWKGFRGWSPAADLWTAEGYESWGIYYDNEIGSPGSPHSSVSHFSWLGLNWDANSTDWGVATATGKPVFAHVVASDSNRTTAAGKGASGYMITNLDALP